MLQRPPRGLDDGVQLGLTGSDAPLAQIDGGEYAAGFRRVHLVESPRDLAYDCAHLNDGYIPQPSLGIPRITDL